MKKYQKQNNKLQVSGYLLWNIYEFLLNNISYFVVIEKIINDNSNKVNKK